MRRAVRTGSDQACALVEDSGDAVDFRCFQRFFESERGQDGGHALCEHGLAGAGRADHEDIVASSAGDFDGTLGGLLATDILEIDEELLGFTQKGVAIGLDRDDAVARIHEMNHVEQRFHRIDIQA